MRELYKLLYSYFIRKRIIRMCKKNKHSFKEEHFFSHKNSFSRDCIIRTITIGRKGEGNVNNTILFLDDMEKSMIEDRYANYREVYKSYKRYKHLIPSDI